MCGEEEGLAVGVVPRIKEHSTSRGRAGIAGVAVISILQ